MTQPAQQPKRLLKTGASTLEIGNRTLIMGILNVTPDSFSDGGRFDSVEAALAHAREMVALGADILDIGGESTRPGHAPVSAEEEIARVVPVIRRLAQELPHVPLSIDTFKASVARAAVEAGAHIVNDIWGFLGDSEMAQTCADLGVPVILMHNRDVPHESRVLENTLQELRDCVARAHAVGIPDEQIWLDPGIGFGKTYEHNLYVMQHLEKVCALGYPVLLGTSRKSMIGHALDLPVDQRVEGTAATVALGIVKGVEMVRVHDIQEMTRVARMTDAMVRSTFSFQ
ncbi:dihydropteroate synthase [Tumebacillus flagellatus]|uniref:Dihydropteroate synthase n=1 Tax=Tumebacillus flagellatus TaxID=1157490 RepID=A0A074MB00_9BACL|nr:dihydropteroate synthase [Tumebacillus flagellatus]KEO83087.1 dihydropteroate synthase [Tumebacillus flagellatus]